MLQMKCRRWKPGNAQGFLLSIKPVQMPPLTDLSLCAIASERGHTSTHAGWEKVEIAEMIVISSLSPFFFSVFRYCGKEQMEFHSSCNNQQY